MKCRYISLLFVMFFTTNFIASDFMNAMKGIGSSFESFGKSIASMGKGLAMGFGAPPTGYVYSYTIVNDTALPIYVNTQEIASFMGAYFPRADGWSQAAVLPFTQQYTVSNKEYYFEMSIHADKNEPSNHLPYVNTDALYIQDCIQLPANKNSTKMNYFHVYMGKDIQQGAYVHVPKAEYMGYADPSHAKDANASVLMSDTLTGAPALTIYNSTQQDLQVGYSSKNGVTSLSKKDCDLFLTELEKKSFIFHNGFSESATSKKSLPLGTIGLFEPGASVSSELFKMPALVFGGQNYTLEVYQDGKNERGMGLQALMSAHDVPVGRVRDITPVRSVFWYQSVAQLPKSDAQGMIDLWGQVWVVSQGKDDTVLFQVPIGTAMQFDIVRPLVDQERWVYFLYIDIANGDKRAERFLKHFVAGKIGTDTVERYKKQSVHQFHEIQTQLSNILTFSDEAKKTTLADPEKMIVPEALLQAAMQGVLKVNQGKIEDTALDITGYLLGADVFLSQGIGDSSIIYYQLAPSQQTATNVPTVAVINGYTMGILSAPQGMPEPTIYASAK